MSTLPRGGASHRRHPETLQIPCRCVLAQSARFTPFGSQANTFEPGFARHYRSGLQPLNFPSARFPGAKPEDGAPNKDQGLKARSIVPCKSWLKAARLKGEGLRLGAPS